MAPSPQGTKRLSDTDVKEIFASLYEYGRRPPPHLQFQIVPVVRRIAGKDGELGRARGLCQILRPYTSIGSGTQWLEALPAVARI